MDRSGNCVFYDSTGCLKVYQKTTGDILTLDEGQHIQERRILFMGPAKDRFLFRKNHHCLQEYIIVHHTPKLSKEYFDEKQVIEDFCYYRSKGVQTGKAASALNEMKHEYDVLIMTQTGILRRVNTKTGKSRKFEIDPTGDTFKICFCEFLSYILITFTRNQLDNIEQVAYVAAIDDSDIKFVNNVYFQTGVGKVFG